MDYAPEYSWGCYILFVAAVIIGLLLWLLVMKCLDRRKP
jgi:hypothetical protein